MSDNIRDAIGAFLRDQVLAEGVELTPESSLENLGVDSFSLMEVILFLERKFGIALPPESLTPENIESVNTLAACAEAARDAAN